MGRKINIYPDPNSWLSDIFIEFSRTFQNELFLSLWDALNEYVGHHSNECAYLGHLAEGPLSLYPRFSYNPKTRIGKLERIFFVSEKPLTILTHNYLREPNYDPNRSPIFNFFNRKVKGPEDEFPHINFMIQQNNMEPAAIRDILLKASYDRHSAKRLYVMENEARGVEYDKINMIQVKLDLSLLRECLFLDATRYASFNNLLPPDLVVEVMGKVEFSIPSIPKHLKEVQLIKN